MPRMRLGLAVVVVSLLAACGFDGPAAGVTDGDGGIIDGPAANQVTVGFSTGASTTDEAAGTHKVRVELSGPSEVQVTVNYDVAQGGTATAGDDYTLPPGQLMFAPGETSHDITMTIAADQIDEPDESFTILLGTPVGAALGTAMHVVTISNHPVPRVKFAVPDLHLSESNTTPQISIVMSETTTLPVSVSYQVKIPAASATVFPAGAGDYTLADGTLTIPSQSTSVTVPLVIINDTLDEENEQLQIVITGVVNAEAATDNQTFTYTIDDDDGPPTIGFAAAATTLPENAGASGVAVALSTASGRVVSINYTATAGTASTPADFTVTDGTLTFQPGETTKMLPVAIAQDTLDENDETFVVHLATPTNADLTGIVDDTVTIADDDDPPVVTFATAAEAFAEDSAGTKNITVQISAISGRDVTVAFASAAGSTATQGTDYTYSPSPVQVVTIPAGSSNTPISVVVTADTVDEVNETIITTLSTPTNAALGAQITNTFTIIDDDPTCFGSGDGLICVPDMPTATVTLGALVDTDADVRCVQPTSTATPTCAIVGTTVTQSGTTVATGSKLLAVVSAGAMTITGTIDGSSHRGGTPGPGASATACTSATMPGTPTMGATTAGGGGAGGTFASVGGTGGSGDAGTGLAGTNDPTAVTPTTLRAGCVGVRGANNGGNPGRGGGGIYLFAVGTLALDGATVNVSGAGATAGGNLSGGSGGGSGGMLVVAGGAITTSTLTKLFANGGSGAGGGDTNHEGADGVSSTSPTDVANGGNPSGGGGTGGNAYANNNPATNGAGAGISAGGGGGGGGGGFLGANHGLGSASQSAGKITIAP